MKDVRQSIASNRFPYLQMTSMISHSISGREKEGRKEKRKGWGPVGYAAYMEPWADAKQVCHQLLSGFLVNEHLP